jgi:hypothetical protein
MTRRIDSALTRLERRRIEQNAVPIALAWIREGLMRKFALLSDQGLPRDWSAQCAVIDQDQARRQAPAIKAALAFYNQRYHVGDAKEQLLGRFKHG